METQEKTPKKRPVAARATKPEVEERRTRPIRVMISSRNKDLIPRRGGGAVSLLDVRKQLLAELEDELLCGQHALQVWLNEKAGGQAGNDTIWDKCRDELRDAHVIIVISNGEAGWRRQRGGIGICHEEIKYAFDHFPSKLYLIKLEFPTGPEPKPKLISPAEVAQKPRNRAFAQFLEDIGRWQVPAFDDESLKEAVKLAVANAVSDLTITGSREGHKGPYSHGAPLDWSRLGYKERKLKIERAVTDCLLGLRAAHHAAHGEAADMVLKLGGAQVLLRVHGVPASFGIAEARELVGRPYLFDHTTSVALRRSPVIGPVHLIACHKSCTESQVFSFMGHPDVYIVQTRFGFFAADPSSFAQTFFLTGCRDRDATAVAVEQMFEWIAEADEAAAIVTRARSRQRILATIQAQIKAHPRPSILPAPKPPHVHPSQPPAPARAPRDAGSFPFH